MIAAALLQRRVLRAGGVVIPARSMLAIALAGNAISITLPIGGSAAGTAFTYRQLRNRGADPAVASGALMISGTISLLVLAAVLVIGAGHHVPVVESLEPPVIAMLMVIILAAAAAAASRSAIRARTTQLWQRASAPAMDWRAALGGVAWSTINWASDIICFAVCLLAVGAPVPINTIPIIYAAMLGSASLSFTPAGIGVVETASTLALTRAGLAAEPAIAASVFYRAISCWIPVAVGWGMYRHIRRRGTPSQSADRRPPLLASRR
jgi:uncharacterized membrane protein YbhN (UPF0104 family)